MSSTKFILFLCISVQPGYKCDTVVFEEIQNADDSEVVIKYSGIAEKENCTDVCRRSRGVNFANIL
jgi:hypothetical protein